MVIDWFRFAFRQLATALVVVTSILLLSEILLPSSVLPYFNLHILVLVTFVIAVASGGPPAPLSGGLRAVVLVPLAVLLFAYAWVVFGTSTSGMMLFIALAIVLVGVIIALGTTSPSIPLLRKEREDRIIEETVETITITEDGIEIDETSVFMR